MNRCLRVIHPAYLPHVSHKISLVDSAYHFQRMKVMLA
jgi:hypothetical protein